MFRPGVHNHLRALRKADHGWYLGDEAEQVLLPNRYVPEGLEEGDRIRVFLYFDSEDRLIATTLEPKGRCDEFAALTCKDVSPYGAFMDWGLAKDLLVPKSEQINPIQVGETHVVYIYLDEASQRLVGSTRIHKFLEVCKDELNTGEEVDVLLYDETELGWKAIVDGRYAGLLFHNKISKPVKRGEWTRAFVENIREDGKIDLSLNKQGYERISEEADKLMQLLKENNGSLPIHDKSAPEDVRKIAGMSKKTFKMAIGQLYKKRLIELSGEGISLKEA